MNTSRLKKIFFIAAAAAAVVYVALRYLNHPPLPDAFASGNGRIESTRVDVAAKFPARLAEVLVQEGETVEAGQLIARLDTAELEARLRHAQAQVKQAVQNLHYTRSLVVQRESELSLARKNLLRSQNLYIGNNIPLAQLQQHETAVASMEAALEALRVQVASAEEAIQAARAQEEAVQANLDEALLRSPINGRVLYRLLEKGEVAGAGGKVVSLVSTEEVHMNIFLSAADAGKLAIGAQARIVLDALPGEVIPARVVYVSPEAQFTPKEIETQSEREKLMFRIKVQVDPAYLLAHPLNSGTPGTATVRLDENVPWPVNLTPHP